ncbi:hypothetical protein JW948_06800 [bacterium]|nr:hypothetical protein [bacterium]
MDRDNQSGQMSFLNGGPPVCHFFDRNGALRTGRIIRRYTKGRRKGRFLVEDVNGKRFVPEKIRNIEV